MKHFRPFVLTKRSYKKIIISQCNPLHAVKQSKTVLQPWDDLLRLGFLVRADRCDVCKSQSLSEEKGKCNMLSV